ncbi:4-(cytidine 5'-diphospho)-2-C-methyl-D-erythritol kinase [Helicobacter sp. MIT 11-5569]|uniref:4-(cytidine 5'-diphospho)-2-C-methyl-D-erythritol kinase n=1 Tax=Helicobacter sp. MIT 11-5569 TaxID=1548151 RepID=UPI000B011047|nr:4-(cytidine 5'-diphospho)-2-C-methyl-D-erythritol kinase [Helicobacter sp. MIT 11-5569]
MPFSYDLATSHLQSCSTVVKSYAKINLFLKIVGKTQINNTHYHLLQSRFMRVSSLYDSLGFNFNAKEFDILGDFDCSMEQNVIYKAYIALLSYVSGKKAESLKRIQVIVHKNIPSGGGLGGGSSNAACFLNTINKELKLGLPQETLMQIGAQVGSDVPFFISDLELANVEGRGEIVTPYPKESSFDVDIIMPKVHCSTVEVFKKYANNFYSEKEIANTKAQAWLKKTNMEILQNNAFVNNDLLKPLLTLYPNLESYCKNGVFLSGSGSCFWKKKAGA